METSGFDELTKALNDLSKRVEELSGEHSIPLSDLLTTGFMHLHSKYLSAEDFFKAGGFEFNSQEEFEKIPEVELDQHIQSNTNFLTWSEMLDEAVKDYMTNKLELG